MKPYYSDERVTLYGGDALAVLASLPTASVDAVVTDPPYSSGGMMRGDRAQEATHRKYSGTATDAGQLVGFSGDSRDQRSYAYWAALWLSECLRATKPGGRLITFTDWRQLAATSDAIQAGGWIWRGLATWRKLNARPQSWRITQECEFIPWASNGALPGTEAGAPTFAGHYESAPLRERDHVTQKPLEVMRALCLAATPSGGTILDPFMGSGTTGAAAVMEGRSFIGIEMVPHFQQVAQRRITDAQAQDALDFTEETDMSDELTYVDRMPAVVCHACGWWQYDVPTDTPRGGNRPPAHCPECIKHHGIHIAPTPVWVRFEGRATA